jgi:hypothetical protein
MFKNIEEMGNEDSVMQKSADSNEISIKSPDVVELS